METTLLKTNIHCQNCIDTIEPILKAEESVKEYSFDLDHPDRIITIESNGIQVDTILKKISSAGYKADLLKIDNDFGKLANQKFNFWSDANNWKRASFNTLNCLIGCSIGDFGMIIFLQANYPSTSLATQMILAIIAGLITSIALETVILKRRENFSLGMALKTAFSMSFISMIGMELAMNLTDFWITGGKAAFDTIGYWMALLPAMLAGFILPLPYNYYKLQKFGMLCH